MNAPLHGALREIVQDGTIRVAINAGNLATVTVAPYGAFTGPSVDVARALGKAAGLRVTLLPFASAGALLAGEADGADWDIACLAIDPSRRERFHFSRPYLTFDASYAVHAKSSFATPDDLDGRGVRIASVTGAAYDAYLQRTLHNAECVALDGPRNALAAFNSGRFDALAGVRAVLERTFLDNPDVRILGGSFMVVEHALAVPLKHARAASGIDAFVAQYQA